MPYYLWFYLLPTGNTYGKMRYPRYIERQWNTFHVTMKIPKDVQSRLGRTKFDKSLGTDSLSEAEVLKLPYIAEWKALIKAARDAKGPMNVSAIEDQVRLLRAEIQTKWVGYEQDAVLELADSLRDHKDQDFADELLSRVAGDWHPTAGHLEAFLEQYDAQPKTIDEAVRNIRQFSEKFRIFETTTEEQLKAWLEGMQSTRSAPTIKKKLGHIKSYWAFCYQQKLTSTPPPPDGLLEFKKARTKNQIRDKIKKTRLPFSVEDYHRLLKAKPDDQQLMDLIKLGAHTGCRREELCSMQLHQVKEDRFVVEDAKTKAGWREIPIHRDIKQTVARMIAESTDGYLFSGLSTDQYGKRGGAIGRRFLRVRDKLGFSAQYVLHSFRKTLAGMMNEHGVPESHAALIIGHDLDTMTYGLYGNEISFKKKVEVMDLVSFQLPQ